MYFPFLYGRQSELLAIRSLLSNKHPLDRLVPVIEPVNQDVAPLARCFEACSAVNQPVVVILNPDKHQLDGNNAADAWRKNIIPLLEKHPFVLPAYRCHSATKQSNLDGFFKLFPERETAILYFNTSLSDEAVKAVASRDNVRFHIVLNGKISSAQRSLLPKRKYVEINDDFNKLSRNADYGEPEFFTDRHKTFSSSGIGFGDYAAIGAAFQAKGSTPAAVAIHAIYKHSDTGDIWVEHFVSEDKDRMIGDVASKFLQAAQKLVIAAKKRPIEFGKNFALSRYESHVEESSYPGLPKNKEMQIAHHVCLVLDILDGSI